MKKTKVSNIIEKTKIYFVLLVSSVLLSGCNLLDTLFQGKPEEVTPKTLFEGLVRLIDIAGNSVAVIATIFFIWGGLQYLTSFGDREKMEKGKKTVMWAIIGIVVVLLAKIVLLYGLSLIMKEDVITPGQGVQ